jgi:hypothetical protein
MTTGTITREWYRFFFNLFQLTGGGTNDITLDDLQLGPSSQIANDSEIAKEFDDVVSTASSFLGELQQQIDLLSQEIGSMPQLQQDSFVSFFGPAVLSKLVAEGVTVGRGAGAVDTNTAVGLTTMFSNTTGDENTAFGYQTLYSNNTGARNTAVGSQALVNNTNGNDNTAVGRGALSSNNTGFQNVGLGYQPLFANQSGSDNISIGYRSLFNAVSASQNVAVGTRALNSATAGNNTAVGFEALNANTSGTNNVAIGHSALINVTTGSGNFGAAFRDSTGAYLPVSDPTTASDQVVMGHTSVTNAFIKVAWTVTSDARDKTNFARVPHGLEFVNKLRPVAFQFRTSRDSDETSGRVRYGFRAQDILKLEGDSPVIINAEDSENLKYNGESLVPVLVNAIQEQQVLIEELWASVGKLYERIK